MENNITKIPIKNSGKGVWPSPWIAEKEGMALPFSAHFHWWSSPLWPQPSPPPTKKRIFPLPAQLAGLGWEFCIVLVAEPREGWVYNSICKIPRGFATRFARTHSWCAFFFALFQAWVDNFDTIPLGKLLEHFILIVVALLFSILLSWAFATSLNCSVMCKPPWWLNCNFRRSSWSTWSTWSTCYFNLSSL